MDPRDKARIDAGVGGVAFVLSVLRGRTIVEAQADARAAVVATSPLVAEIAPHAERIWKEREAKRAQKKEPICGMRAGVVCVLPLRHKGFYHQDEHGTLFAEDE